MWNVENVECFVNNHKLNGERFDLDLLCFVCDCTSLALAELSYKLTFQFFLRQKGEQLCLIFVSGLTRK